jgi:hypothetical protein
MALSTNLALFTVKTSRNAELSMAPITPNRIAPHAALPRTINEKAGRRRGE